jgi:hypothetical protein
MTLPVRDTRLTYRSFVFGICILSLTFISIGQTQVVYVPLDQSVYSFLQRTYTRGFHSLNAEVVPYSTKQIAAALKEIQQKDSLLSENEKKELSFYAAAFKDELMPIDSLWKIDDRWNLSNYHSANFNLTLNPVAGVIIGNGLYHKYYGAVFAGDIGNTVGFNFRFHDNAESGDNIDVDKRNTPETGINIVRRPDPKTIEYSDITATLGVRWGWGTFSLGKDYIHWGMGTRGKLILSSKAPSFPFIRLDLFPTEWLRFYYLHGWLESDVIDSLRSYSTLLAHAPRNIYREKYIAAHLVSLSITRNLNVSFGESIVYSDGTPNFMFLNPLLFYRAVDHYLSRNGTLGDGNNSQFFGNIDYRFMGSS